MAAERRRHRGAARRRIAHVYDLCGSPQTARCVLPQPSSRFALGFDGLKPRRDAGACQAFGLFLECDHKQPRECEAWGSLFGAGSAEGGVSASAMSWQIPSAILLLTYCSDH